MNKLFKESCALALALLACPTLNIKAEDLSVQSIDTSITSDILEVSGKVDRGIYAVIIMVYKDDKLYSIKTTGVDSNNGYEMLFNVEDNNEYEIKVANYEGGNYLTKTVSNKEEETPKKTKEQVITPDTSWK